MTGPVELDELFEALRGAFRRATQISGARIEEMEARISGLEQELRDTEQLLIAAEQQASRLASLYAASYQLHSLDPAELSAAISEIAVDLLGAHRCLLILTASDGLRPEAIDLIAGVAPSSRLGGYPGGDSMIDAALADGQLRLGPRDDSCALAVVPLTMQGNVVGALVVLELLRQKAALGRDDRELLDLLAAHAASALVGARVFQDTRRKLKTLEGLVALVRGGAAGGAR